MKFKIDENLPVEVAVLLQEASHDAVTVVAEQLSGASDQELWAHCLGEERALVTLDLDFSDIRAYLPAAKYGVIVLRSPDQSKGQVLSLVEQIVPLLTTEPLPGRLWLVEKGRVRVREREA